MSFLRCIFRFRQTETPKKKLTPSEYLDKIKHDKVPTRLCDSISCKILDDPLMIDDFTEHAIEAKTLSAYKNNNPFLSIPIQVLPCDFDIREQKRNARKLKLEMENCGDNLQQRVSIEKELKKIERNIFKYNYQKKLKADIKIFVSHLKTLRKLKKNLAEWEKPNPELENLLKTNNVNIDAETLEKLLKEHEDQRQEQIIVVKRLLVDALQDYIRFTTQIISDDEGIEKNEENDKRIAREIKTVLSDERKLCKKLIASLPPKIEDHSDIAGSSMPFVGGIAGIFAIPNQGRLNHLYGLGYKPLFPALGAETSAIGLRHRFFPRIELEVTQAHSPSALQEQIHSHLKID